MCARKAQWFWIVRGERIHFQFCPSIWDFHWYTMTHFFTAVSKDATVKSFNKHSPISQTQQNWQTAFAKISACNCKKRLFYTQIHLQIYVVAENFFSLMWPLLFCFLYRSKARIRPNRKPQDIQHLQVI
jgi:hypothetical protein